MFLAVDGASNFFSMRVLGDLPDIVVALSDEQLIKLMRLLTSIPLPPPDESVEEISEVFQCGFFFENIIGEGCYLLPFLGGQDESAGQGEDARHIGSKRNGRKDSSS